MSTQLDIMKERVSIFVTQPGYYYRPHKDGIDHRMSLNYAIQVLDDDCITSWYKEEELKKYALTGLTWQHKSREVKGFDKANHTPAKSMTAKPGECILFNTDIYHSWDNSNSLNERRVLTLRDVNVENVYYDDIKKILFGN